MVNQGQTNLSPTQLKFESLSTCTLTKLPLEIISMKLCLRLE
jgi:hypothetical protein